MYTDQAELEGIIKQAAKERLRLEKQLAERPVSHFFKLYFKFSIDDNDII